MAAPLSNFDQLVRPPIVDISFPRPVALPLAGVFYGAGSRFNLMQIQLEVYGTLRDRLKDRLPGGRGTLDVPDGTTLEQLALQLDVAIVPRCVVMVNGQMEQDRTRPLPAGAQLKLIPPVAGG